MKIYTLNTINVEEPLSSSVSIHQSKDSAIQGVLASHTALNINNGISNNDEVKESLEKYGNYFDNGNDRLYIIKEHTI